MKGFAALSIAVVVLVSTVAAVGVAADGQVNATVSSVLVDPQPPEPDEEFTVRATIRNLESSDSHFEIDRVELRTGSNADEQLDEIEITSPPRSIAPGRTKTVTLEGELESAGLHKLYVHVYGTADDGTAVHLQYPFELRVDDEHPQLDFSFDDPVAGVESPVAITVSNGIGEDLRNAKLTLSGEAVSFQDDEQVRSRLPSGEDATFEFDAVPAEAGERAIVATLRYTDATGERQTVTRRFVPSVEPLEERVEVDASSSPDGSTVSVDVTNLGNAPIEDVVVAGSSDAVVAGKRVIDEVGPGTARTVLLNVSEIDADGRVEVPVTAAYDVGDRTGEVETTTRITSNPGEIELTGIEVEPDGDRVHVSGSASNVGLSEANSVVVRVVPDAGVQPAQPNREYFVGTVPESDFVTFDVYARLNEGVTEIPLEVTYLVDGERHTREAVVEYERAPDAVEDGAGDDGLLLPGIIGGAIVLGVVAIMAIAWRNSRGGV